jgi:hypothetical protein
MKAGGTFRRKDFLAAPAFSLLPNVMRPTELGVMRNPAIRPLARDKRTLGTDFANQRRNLFRPGFPLILNPAHA